MKDTIIYYARRYWKAALALVLILVFGVVGFIHPDNTSGTPPARNTASAKATQGTNKGSAEGVAGATPAVPAENSEEPTSTGTSEATAVPKSNPEDDTPVMAADDDSGYSKPLSTTPYTIDGTDYDKVCAGIAGYVYSHSRQFAGIPTTYLDSTETSTNWQITSDPDDESGYETWTTTANEANGPDDFPLVTAEVEEKDDSFVVHRLSVGGVMFIKDKDA